jgi:hypothetical protein
LRPGAAGDQPLQQRYAEGQRLAGARPGLADDVVAAEPDRQGQRLDRERVLDPDVRERRADVSGDVEVAERYRLGLGVLDRLGGLAEVCGGPAQRGIRVFARCGRFGNGLGGQGVQPPSKFPRWGKAVAYNRGAGRDGRY